jgi:SAM-dependent methyltransferase
MHFTDLNPAASIVAEKIQCRVDDLLRATARAEERPFWFRGFRWFVQPLIRRALSATTGARVLDCGCGTGANLALFAPFGASYGFDTSEYGLQIGRQAGRRGLVRASAPTVPFVSEAFDLVTSFDVLYALDDESERAAVTEMFRVVRPGGYVIVNVAAMPILRGDHSILSHELRRYTRETLTERLTAAGFTVVRITHTNATLFLPMLAVRLLHRARGFAAEARATAEISVPFAPVNAILSALLFLESVWLRAGANPFGSSLLCLARKPVDAGRPALR